MLSRTRGMAAKVNFITYLRTPDGLRVSGLGSADVMFGDEEKEFDQSDLEWTHRQDDATPVSATNAGSVRRMLGTHAQRF